MFLALSVSIAKSVTSLRERTWYYWNGRHY